MDQIAEFIVNHVADESNNQINYSVMQCGAEMDMSIDEMCNDLYHTIDMWEEKVSELTLYIKNVGIQRATLISFKYEGRNCEIGEHFGTQRDYFWVRMLPVDN
jgi:hypothetical protein